MGELNTVFQAEVLALLRCVEHLASLESLSKHIIICSNNKAAIKAVSKPFTEFFLGLHAGTRKS